MHAATGILEEERPAATTTTVRADGGRVVHCVAEEAAASGHPLRMHDGRAVRGQVVSEGTPASPKGKRRDLLRENR